MIDKNKALKEYSKEELIEALNSKKDIDSYFLLKLVYEENAKTDKYYSYFDDFFKMIYDKSSFKRMRGFGLCSSLAKWDKDKKIDEHLSELLILLEDEKPITIRTVIANIKDILKYKPYLAKTIKNNLKRIDVKKYKETMIPLIEKDIKELEEIIDSLDVNC